MVVIIPVDIPNSHMSPAYDLVSKLILIDWGLKTTKKMLKYTHIPMILLYIFLS